MIETDEIAVSPPSPAAPAVAGSAHFTRAGELFAPNPSARGWWVENSLQGRAIVALLGRTLDREHGEPGLLPARLTVDMHSMAPFAPVRIETREVRSGRRLRLAEAVLLVDGREYARATCQFLRPGEPPDHAAYSPPAWGAPPPEAIPSHPVRETDLSEFKNIAGRMGSPYPRQIWLRERHAIVTGEEPSPWDRLAACADFASPWAHSGDKVGYINTDISTMIHRLPEGEWIGFEATGHEASHGIAVGHCRLHDPRGAFGFATATAAAMQRRL